MNYSPTQRYPDHAHNPTQRYPDHAHSPTQRYPDHAHSPTHAQPQSEQDLDKMPISNFAGAKAFRRRKKKIIQKGRTKLISYSQTHCSALM